MSALRVRTDMTRAVPSLPVSTRSRHVAGATASGFSKSEFRFISVVLCPISGWPVQLEVHTALDGSSHGKEI